MLQCTVMDSNVNTRTVFFFFLLLVDLKRIMNRFDIEINDIFIRKYAKIQVSWCHYFF